ncbi:molybdate transport system ATP-binding protein [Saonia flava]|uniref:Molybdate transport system ATP-binding protein n=1 Tax=Saonia flava TaxID=523696 RepID=A0A846R742_9FLAO|nr:ATP-binding cassette domain-containing protein [Saonia flava]NJB72589.1 molybdate transport system ATP-binding protein [Saonia flava]
MNPKKHWALFINNQSNKEHFIYSLLKEDVQGFEDLSRLKGALFSKLALVKFIDEEERHESKLLTKETPQLLKTMSSGEQKKALLTYLLDSKPDFLILDNPFDNLDVDFQKELKQILGTISQEIHIVQLVSRKIDVLPFVSHFANLDNRTVHFLKDSSTYLNTKNESGILFNKPIPPPLKVIHYSDDVLVALKNVSVQFKEKPVLQNINWKIKQGEFWQLIGKNGSGKTTILSMITGDSIKGYGQDLYLFGQKKGSGETVWDIKKKIGYFTPSMTDKFTGHHSLEHMVISGLHDSIGLYKKPTETQVQLAKEWLGLIGMWDSRKTYFHDLSMGQKRLIMTVRAMVKHPLLLILDEPTAGLDDESALLFVHLVNKIAQESTTAILFVSHRTEPGLEPQFVYELAMTPNGSLGKVAKNS